MADGINVEDSVALFQESKHLASMIIQDISNRYPRIPNSQVVTILLDTCALSIGLIQTGPQSKHEDFDEEIHGNIDQLFCYFLKKYTKVLRQTNEAIRRNGEV